MSQILHPKKYYKHILGLNTLISNQVHTCPKYIYIYIHACLNKAIHCQNKLKGYTQQSCIIHINMNNCILNFINK